MQVFARLIKHQTLFAPPGKELEELRLVSFADCSPLLLSSSPLQNKPFGRNSAACGWRLLPSITSLAVCGRALRKKGEERKDRSHPPATSVPFPAFVPARPADRGVNVGIVAIASSSLIGPGVCSNSRFAAGSFFSPPSNGRRRLRIASQEGEERSGVESGAPPAAMGEGTGAAGEEVPGREASSSGPGTMRGAGSCFARSR